MDNPSIKRVETITQHPSINDTNTNVTRSPSDTPRAKQSNLGVSGATQAFSDRSLSEKSDSADANIVISVENLLNPSVSSISNNSSKLTLKIENLNELQAMQILLTSQPKAEFIDKINTLDLTAITIDKTTKDLINKLLTTIFQNPNFNSNLTTLSLGDIDSCTLPKITNNIRNLSIGNINPDSSFIIPDSFKNLTIITTGSICKNAFINIPKQLNLETLIIKHVGEIARIIAPKGSLSNLITLGIGNMGHKARFKVSDSLDNLVNLCIGRIEKDADLTLANSLRRLKNLTIHGSVTRILPTSLNSLTTLSITHIFNDATRALLVSLDKFDDLKTLVIGDIYDTTAIKLPSAINNVTIGNTKNNCILTLSISSPHFTNFQLGNMGTGAILKLQNPLTHLTTLVFGTIQDEATRELLESMLATIINAENNLLKLKYTF